MEEMNNNGPQSTGAVPVTNVNPGVNPARAPAEEVRTPVERMAESAREQATEAAEAFRRGEFMAEAAVDTAASPDDRLIALLSYATQVVIPLVMPVIVLMSESSKKRPFQRYHAVQSLALALLCGAALIFLGVGSLIALIVPIIGWLASIVMACFIPIGWAMGVLALLYYGYQAYQGKRFAIPGLTTFLRDQGWLA
jgi:uncharacterized membrane protein